MSGEIALCYSEETTTLTSLVGIAHSIANGFEHRVLAVRTTGSPAEGEPDLRGCDAVYAVSGPATLDPSSTAEMLRSLVAELGPTLILLGSTKFGREVAGRLAGQLDLPAATGISRASIDGASVRVERETLSGNGMAFERVVRRPAILAFLPPSTPPPRAPAKTVERHERAMPAPPGLTERVEVRPKARGSVDVTSAERIVTVGRGLQKKEDLGLIEELAKALNAEIGCTRPLAEAGWLSDDHWIGLTGHRVHPRLYVAVGVSGAVQHLVGMRASTVVVALNKDANAPIFDQADYRVVGDLYRIVPALTKALGRGG